MDGFSYNFYCEVFDCKDSRTLRFSTRYPFFLCIVDVFLVFFPLWNAFVHDIHVQVLCHVVPSLVKLRKEGLDGHEKIKNYMWVYLSILSMN